MRTPEEPKGPPKKGVALSVVFHVVIGLLVFFMAAREGAMGEKFKKIAVVIVPKKKEPEKPKEEKKIEPPKIEEPKKEIPKPPTVKEASAKPVERVQAPPVLINQAAPAAAIPADFAFSGSSTVATTTDPVEAYQGLVQYELETSWNYPRGLKDSGLVAEVEVTVDPKGVVTFKNWKQRSNNKEWDDSVEKVFQKTRTLRRQPPGGFPPLVTVRFDMVVNRELNLN